MVTDRVNMRETGDGAEASAVASPFAEEVSTRPTAETRTSESSVLSPSTASMLSGFSLEGSTTSMREVGTGRSDKAATTGPDAPPAPTTDGTTAPRDGKDTPDQPPTPRDDRPGKLGEVFKQLLDDLMKGPLGDIMREVGRQLVSGNFDFDRLQNMAQNIRLDEGQVQQVSQQLGQFTDALREQTGIDIQVNLGNKPGKPGVRVNGIRMAQAGGNHNFNASLSIPADGKPQGHSEFIAGYAGPMRHEMPAEEAAQAIRDAALDRRFAKT